jgi:hypothetical protein
MRAGLDIPYIVCGPCTSCGKPGAHEDAQNVDLLSGYYNAGGERYRNHNGVRDSLSQGRHFDLPPRRSVGMFGT